MRGVVRRGSLRDDRSWIVAIRKTLAERRCHCGLATRSDINILIAASEKITDVAPIALLTTLTD